MSAGPDVVAIVPVKALHLAKGRLAEHMNPSARRQLVAWMLERVLSALRGAGGVGEVIVAAGDAQAAALARDLGAEAQMQEDGGLNSAIATADRVFAGAAASLVVAADLPLCTSADVDAVCQVALGPAGVVVVPTWDGGTGMLLRRPPSAIAPAYGDRSAKRHLDVARRAGLPAVALHRSTCLLDIDTPVQLRLLQRWVHDERLPEPRR